MKAALKREIIVPNELGRPRSGSLWQPVSSFSGKLQFLGAHHVGRDHQPDLHSLNILENSL